MHSKLLTRNAIVVMRDAASVLFDDMYQHTCIHFALGSSRRLGLISSSANKEFKPNCSTKKNNFVPVLG